MSVLVEFAIFPTDKGDSVSQHVSKVINLIRESEVPYQLTAMGTLIETETVGQALEIVNKSYDLLAQDCDRVYCTMNMDIQKDKPNRITSKIESIESKIGAVNR